MMNQKKQQRKKHKTRRINAKDLLTFIAVIAIIVVALYVIELSNYSYIEDLDGSKYFVQYTTLNVRETPGGTIIDELSLGNKVQTTGNVYDFEGQERWIQIILDDGVTTAWIIDSGIGL